MAQIQPLSADLQKVACEELGEVPARIPEDLQVIKLWIQQQPHLRCRTDDQFLIQFLRGCKYSLEKAKNKLDHFNALKTKYPEMFLITNVDEPKFRENHNCGVLIPLPIPLNGNGPRIMFYRFINPVAKATLDETFRPLIAMQEVMLIGDPYACVQGVVYVVDLAKATASHFLQFGPAALKRIFLFLEKTSPLRIKSICYINAPAAAESFFKILLACASEKLRQRIFIFRKNTGDLYDHVSQKYMPEEYGGANGSLEQLCADYNKVWDAHREYFKQNADYGTDEHLRLGKPLDFDGVFGTGGSFRKLNVD